VPLAAGQARLEPAGERFARHGPARDVERGDVGVRGQLLLERGAKSGHGDVLHFDLFEGEVARDALHVVVDGVAKAGLFHPTHRDDDEGAHDDSTTPPVLSLPDRSSKYHYGHSNTDRSRSGRSPRRPTKRSEVPGATCSGKRTGKSLATRTA